MNDPSSLPIPDPQFRLPIHSRPHRRFPTALATGLALLAGFAGVFAGPAPAFPLEPAFELAADARPEPVPLRWARAWMLAKVTINGADAGWFKIATGWDFSAIDPQVAARLKLPMVSECGLMDFIADDAIGRKSKSYRADVLQCGAASARDVRLAPFDLAEMSEGAVKMYGEGISGVLGWDLLKTLPFVLDEPGLKLEWQREATPAEGATRIPVMEKNGYPFIEITAGKGCKIPAMLNSAGDSVSIQKPFLKKHAEQIWNGPVIDKSIACLYTFYDQTPDDDGLPVRENLGSLGSSRWLTVECAGMKQMLRATIDPRDKPRLGEFQLGYGWLRRVRVLVDGPGNALWLKPAQSTPEVEITSNGRPEPSPYLLIAALRSAVFHNDPAAVKALAAAGAEVKGSPDFMPLAGACAGGSPEAALALLEAGAPVDPEPNRKVPGTPLIAACSNGDPVLIKVLLSKGADPDRATLSGFTPLMAAARSGGPAAVQALRGKAQFPKDPNSAHGILADACEAGNLLLAKEMLAQIPVKAQPRLEWPKLLESALLCGHEEMVAWLLKTGEAGLASKGDELQPLLAAILPTRIEKTDAIRERMVTKLLAAGADPNAACNGVTPLLLAARHGHAAIVKALMAAGAKATATDHKMRDPLLRAATANQPLDVIAPLLKAGLDVNGEDSSTDLTVVATYAMHGNLAACAALLDAGADPNARSSFGSAPPVLMAANSPRSTDEDALAVVNLLLKHGAKLEAQPNLKTGPLMLIGAIAINRSVLLKPLVEAGSPVNQEMVSKLTPLALAAAVSTAATVQALLDLGADPKVLDVYGISPLAHAAAAGKTANMALLLAHGASPDASSPEAKPPIWVAASGGQLRAVRALLASGADPDALNPQTKTTALDVAKSRHDQPMVALLENQPRKK